MILNAKNAIQLFKESVLILLKLKDLDIQLNTFVTPRTVKTAVVRITRCMGLTL